MNITRRGRWRGALAAAVAVSVALVAGCAGTGPGAGASSEPTQGGDVVFLTNSLSTTWVPNLSSISSYEGNIWGQITDKLVYVDDKGAASPWLATSWDQNADATEFTLHLKEGVTFSDGTPFDAAAVVQNLDYWAFGQSDKGITPIGLFPKTYKGSTAVDAQTVKVDFSAPTLGFIPTLGYHGSILISPKTLALSKEQQADLSNFSGTGPFTVASWTQGDNVKLVKRADYDWAPAALGHTGPAYLDSLTYKQVSESSTRIGALTSGQAQVIYNIQPSELSTLSSQGYGVYTPRYLGFTNGYRVNTQAAPFDDVRVRQSVQHSIDRDQILKTVYTPDWHAAEGFIQSNVPEATDHSADFAYDADKAASLLDEAGWVRGADGKRSNGREAARGHALRQPLPGDVRGDRRARVAAADGAGMDGGRPDLRRDDLRAEGAEQREHAAVRGHPVVHRRRDRRERAHERQQGRGLVRPRGDRHHAQRPARPHRHGDRHDLARRGRRRAADLRAHAGAVHPDHADRAAHLCREPEAAGDQLQRRRDRRLLHGVPDEVTADRPAEPSAGRSHPLRRDP
ncbi:ABC transporter substrate-binding protein [Microbacterium sp. SORGH_AS_0888]|uniref:ABC transporter substrate-binding protein n=1 Tax=Microbacterium sp. SORGH_AS_0888 TaxID=3041791 RepID=UPI00277FA7F0|nr:ABC transporter substrate-binding protein [Microbacterium sp. SORGH_AS_0888]MDQ1130537.1 ABC-type transport system substrate-binding protein [Microbacterium sp. SORGH_AS_0888]